MKRSTLLLFVALAACHGTEVNEPPKTVVAIFDPAALRIPLPNDLTMRPAAANANAIATLSGPIDPATLSPMSVRVIDVTGMFVIGDASVSFDTSLNQLVVAPPATGWPVGHRIAVALRGSPGGLRAPDNVPVVAAPAFYFARAAQPISNCTAPGAGCVSFTPALSVEQAIGLEQLRQALAPLITALVGLGVPREEMALVWTFTVGGP